MPTVPVYQRQSQSEMAPVNTQNLRIPQGNGLTALADVGANALGVYQQQREREDLAFAQNALLQFNQQADDLINNPQTGLITKQGANAIGQGDQVAGQLSQMAGSAFDSIPDGPVKERFRNQFAAAGQPIANRARQYEVGQRQQFEAGQQQGLLANLQTQAENSFDDNEGFVNTNLLAREQIMAYGQAHGQSPEEIESNWVSFRENSAKAALNAQLTAGRFDQFLARNGEPSDVGGVPRVTAHGNSSAARGLRNNNPGNIEASSANPWEGQAGSDGRFAKFETPEHGIRALGKNLLAYQAKGFDTVSEIVNRWAPASDGNNTDAYIKALCGALGIGANDKVDMSNPRTLAALCAGIVKHENGSQPYTDEQLGAGVSAALGLSALESSKRRTGNAAFDAASPATQGTYLRQAQAMQNEQRTLYRAQLDGVARDAGAAYQRGIEYPMPSQDAFTNAYGYNEGLKKYADLDNQRIAGQYIGSFRNMPTASIQEYVKTLRPTAADINNPGGFESVSSAFNHVEAAANQVINQRKSDPYQAATDIGAYRPLNTSNANDVATELNNRFSADDHLKQLGIDAPILSKQEAAGLTEMVRGTNDADQTIGLLQSMGQKLPPVAMRKVAATIAPNNASTAYAALLLGTPDNQYNNRSGTIAYDQFVGYKPTMNKYDVAKTILTGDQLINPTEAQKKAGITAVQLPSDEKLKKAFDDGVGNAFSNNPQARQVAYGIYKAAYASMVYRNADSDKSSTLVVDDDSAEKAVQMATGGVYKGFQGGDVVMPFGMDKSTFKDKYTTAARMAFTDAGIPPAGQSNFTPVNIGNGQYKLLAGSGRWAVNPKTGEPIVVGVE
ncbi:hypothetical protein I5N01_05595 [Serratia marcescens]|nr:hypothetical protein [Serratia marcescens]